MAKSSNSNLGCIIIVIGLIALPIPPLGIALIIYGLYIATKSQNNQIVRQASVKQYTRNNSVIDITNQRTPQFNLQSTIQFEDQWAGVKKRLQLNKDQIYWVDRLVIPYKRSVLNNEQCEDETIKLYMDLLIIVDQYLRTYNNSNINELITRANASSSYYNNILYTLECIAEFEVTNFYKNENSTQSEFSFQILQEHSSKELVTYIRKYLSERSKLITLPSPQTIAFIKPISNSQKEKRKLILNLKKVYGSIDIPIRFNHFLSVMQTQEETAKIYNELLVLIANNYDVSSKHGIRITEFLKNFSENKTKLTYRAQIKRDELRLNLHKIAEDVVRKAYGVKSLPSMKGTFDQLNIIVKPELGLLIIDQAYKLVSKVSLPTSETAKVLKFKTIRPNAQPQIKIDHKVVNIDLKKVQDIEVKNEITIDILNQYLGENQTTTEPVNIQTADSLEDLFANDDEKIELEFDNLESNFLQIFFDNNYFLSHEKVDAYTKSIGKMEGSFIDKINQKFYSIYEDSLILEDSLGHKIDEYYIHVVNKTINHDQH
jgi:hypothetical protein